MIAIADYGMGNIRSVEKALLRIGAEVRITSDPRVLRDARAIVLPGVGAFRDCMKNLEDLSLIDAIIGGIKAGKPFLGICLGLQVLFTESWEFGRCGGLDLFPGKVVKFDMDASRDLKIPHMGWNQVALSRRPPVFDEVPDNAYFYFVHSYYVVPQDRQIVAGTTDYGKEFVSMIWKDNVIATQFHPEKSQTMGLKVLRGFHRLSRA